MSNLPHDLVEEILSRIPATALSRFRSTCKSWDALFKDQRFTKKHFDRAPKQFLHLMLNESRVSSLRVNLHEIDNNNFGAPLIEFKGELALNDSHSSAATSGQVDIFHVFHCDGLLLCNTENTDRLVVWNPCTGETKWILPSNRYCEYSMFALGYEENNKSSSCRNYKLLRYREGHITNEFEIFEFSTGSWRILNVAADFFISGNLGVSLKGNSYWIGDYDECTNTILCFDYSTESIARLSLPFQESYSWTIVLTTVREEEKLSVLHHNMVTLKKEIWVTTNDKIDHNVVLSWRKLFAIDCDNYMFPNCLSFFIDEEKEVAVYCDFGYIYNTIRNKVSVIGENCVYGEIYFGKPIQKSSQAIIFNYVPSLVQIQQGTIIP